MKNITNHIIRFLKGIQKKAGFSCVLAACLLPVFTTAQETTQRIYLSGTGADDAVSWDFFSTAGRNSGKWTSIPVPSNWEQQGFGKYNYGFDKDSLKGKEKGLYKHRFLVPASWKRKKVNIVFQGSMTDTEVKINGKSAGPIHQGAYYAFRYDISDKLYYGTRENSLEVTVSKHSSNESVNDAERRGDFWIFGGIFRPVYLEAFPENHIVQIETDARADGSFKSRVTLSGDAGNCSVQLFDKNGNAFGQKISVTISGNRELVLEGIFNQPALWSSEFPNLYTAVFSLENNGKITHQIERKIGFRTVTLKQRDGIYINGVKMKFKGVNRHSFHPESGRTTSRAISLEDVQLMKEMNMNAVRMSHYPPDDHFLEICDSLGLYVMNELAGWHGHYDTPTGKKLLREMMEAQRQHPSIVIWANGNEGGHNTELDSYFKDWDMQERPLVHPWELFNGIETQHYREYNYGIANYDHGRDILMPTEFLHGMFDGGHGAGLEDYWEAMWRNPLSAGGFLWDFADQGIKRADKNDSIDTDGNHGADGIVGPYHEKEASFYTIKEVWSPVYVEHREITDAFDGRFRVENRYFFTDLKDCIFHWNFRYLDSSATDELIGTTKTASILPGSKGWLKLDLPHKWKRHDVLYLAITDVRGDTILQKSFPISKPSKWVETMLVKEDGQPVTIREQDSVWLVETQHLASPQNQKKSGSGPQTQNLVSLRFNRNNGKLIAIQKNEKTVPLTNGPVLQHGINNFSNFTQHYENNNLIISSAFHRDSAYNTLQWTIYPSGLVQMKIRYFPDGYFTDFVGVNFSWPEKHTRSVDWVGAGPYRVWKNRMKGNLLGVWHKDYNDSETGEYPFQYPEFKGYHANMYWMQLNGAHHSFRVYTDQEDVFFRLFTPACKTDPWNNYVLKFPDGDISFMQGIPGIGTKTQKAENTGPMGGKHIFYDYEKEPARALELVLYFDFFIDNEKK